MTTAVQTPAIDYLGDGITVAFPVPFRYDSPTDLRAMIEAADGSETLLPYGAGFTATGGGTDAGGTLTTAVAPASGTKVHIWRETNRAQTVDYQTNDTFPADTHEEALDRNALIEQEQDREIARSPKVPRGATAFGIDPTGLSDGDLLEYRGGQLQRFDAAPFAGQLYGGDAGTGRPVPVSNGPEDGTLRADLLASAGSALVGWIHTGVGAVLRSIRNRLRDEVFVTDFLDQNLWGTAGYDAAPGIRSCIAAHPGKDIYFPKPVEQYTLGSSLGEIPEGTRLRGSGKKNCKLVRGYSAADYLMVLRDGAELHSMWIDGDSANHTGGGVQNKLGHGRQIGRDIKVVNFAGGIPIHFPCTGSTSAEASGSQSHWDNIEAWRADSSAGLGRHAVVHDDPGVNSAGHPIYFSHLETAGYESIDFGACNNFYVEGSTLFGWKTSTRGVGVDIRGGRVAEGVGGPEIIVLRGSGDLTGVHHYPELEFDSTPGNAWTINGGWQNLGVTDNNPNSTTMYYSRYLESYTPVWQGGGVDVTLGAGSVTGHWQRCGALILFHARLVVAADTVIPAGAITVSLPYGNNAAIPAQNNVTAHISAGGSIYKAHARINSGTPKANLERDTSGVVTNASPAALGVGAVIQISGFYIR